MKQIGKYVIGRELGSGASAKVYEAEHMETCQHRAIKVMTTQNINRSKMERFLHFRKALKHENIVEFIEAIHTPHHTCLVLELVTGGELFAKIMANKYLDEDTARNYFRQLINGVQYCHERGVAHRDLKPENLLLDYQGNLKISDFGSCVYLRGEQDDDELLESFVGTPQYMAPEVINKSGYNGFLADAWSCGIILYVMLAGDYPFYDSNMKQLFQQVKNGTFTMKPTFSMLVSDLISKLLVTQVAG